MPKFIDMSTIGAEPTSGPHAPAVPVLDWAAWRTPFVFFTGKGGVGKTTVAGAVAVALADAGERVLVVSTDPASNLGELFGIEVGPVPVHVPGVPGLEATNLDPDAAAAAYRERVLAPYRGKVSEQELGEIEEQLAGECTVEVAAFDRFTQLMVDPGRVGRYDHVLFDTAPTGHTLRLMNLPSAWSQYIRSTPAGASCLGPRSGLESQRAQYQAAVEQLGDPDRTTLVLVSRPERGALREAARAGGELAALGVENQHLVVNGLLTHPLAGDPIAEALASRQAQALASVPPQLQTLPTSGVPLVSWDVAGPAALRALAEGRTALAVGEAAAGPVASAPSTPLPALAMLIGDLAADGPGTVLVIGKGGVGKTTVAAAIAVALAERGHEVHLSTTDPAGRPADLLPQDSTGHLTVSRIDPAVELARYTAERLKRAARLDPQRRALLEEDLRSPCTEEMAVFRAFSGLLIGSHARFTVVDTAPSGHTLRLLDLAGSYERQLTAGGGQDSGTIVTPLMRLQDPERTCVLIVTLPEHTPVSEAAALQQDLRRAGIEPYGWIVNAALTGSGTRDPVLRARAALEDTQLHRVRTELAERAWLIPWHAETLAGQGRLADLASA